MLGLLKYPLPFKGRVRGGDLNVPPHPSPLPEGEGIKIYKQSSAAVIPLRTAPSNVAG